MGISFLGLGEETAPEHLKMSQRGGTIEFTHAVSKTTVHFLAFITSWTDSFAAALTKDAHHGAATKGVFAGVTDRTISLSFKVVARHEEEALKNLERLNYLSKMIYPTFKSNGGQEASQIYMRFTNIIQDPAGRTRGLGSGVHEGGLGGYLESLSYTFDGDPAGFMDELRTDKNGVYDPSLKGIPENRVNVKMAGTFLPKAIIVNLSFYVSNDDTNMGWRPNIGNTATSWGGVKASEFPYGLHKDAKRTGTSKSTSQSTVSNTKKTGTVTTADDGNTNAEISGGGPVTPPAGGEQQWAVGYGQYDFSAEEAYGEDLLYVYDEFGNPI